ncbi:MAG: tetratricopeptide repeat protein, partial [Nitrospinaceae bacterium]|nr:tetratricopeptide repeat protein [Nitrospinaceae bacterium]NIR55582.1 tetratricopeptide repeat protein [Nitrospinaceae bacterium]NIS86016.1 tetratricopeptide repeat protein [Nitrospinaceae bacterium]NIT82862.1 tetratricopeptide repeat protein [Nitrospinaceae bacterium]NIU45064.1 tetratricopeptide repeat protein [Nitrospinaceae bacterium]
IKLRPDYPQVYYNLGVAYLRLGKEKKALATFRHAVPLGQDFDTADFWLSFCFDRLGQNTCVVSPGNAGSPDAGTVFSNACLWVGNAFLEYALHIPARHAYKKAVRSWPDSAEAHYELGAIHLKRLRNPQRAERYLEKAEQLFVQNNDLHRATLVHQRLRPREKVLDPDKAAQDWLKEGVRLQHLGRYQAAIDAYKMAISFKPNFVDAFYNLGIAYGSLEEVGLPLIPKAIWAFKQAIRAKSDFVHAYIGLGASHLKLREFEEAIGVLESALKLNSQEAQAFYYLG